MTEARRKVRGRLAKPARDRRRRPALRLLAENDAERAVFGVGQTVLVDVDGLQPATPYEFRVSQAHGDRLFTARVISDRQGRIERSVLWPQLGLADEAGSPLTAAAGLELWAGRRLRVDLAMGDRPMASSEFGIGRQPAGPVLFASDGRGRLLNSFEVGDGDAILSAYGLPPGRRVRVFLVPRLFGWTAGLPVRPVRLGRRRAVATGQVGRGGDLRVVVARRAQLAPGAYDFVVRPIGEGDELDVVLRPGDLVGHRYATGLVVRFPFMAAKAVLGGCANYLEMAGRSISGAPYFQYSDTFQLGEDVYAALDPASLDAAHTGQMVALYVVQHKTAAQWTVNPTLQHLPVLGGNAAVQQLLTQPGCINWNKRLIWPAASQVGEYDIVADFGNGSPPAAFTPDATFNMPDDIIDGYFATGFRIVPDPAVDTSFANAGSFAYDETTQGSATVLDDFGDEWSVPLRAKVYFPADLPGATSPAQISAAKPSYPIVVVVHGNSHFTTSYLGYEYLLEHLARNGFIAASIHLEIDQLATDRARILFNHLNIIKSMFAAKAANNVGLMGHSRGGEAVAVAARLNQQESLGHQIKAVIALAPSDWIATEVFQAPWAVPFLVVYGSMDGDIQGPEETGFALFDRSKDVIRSMVFVYGATHGRFNSVWGDWDIYHSGDVGPLDVPKIISLDAHQKVARGYMTAFVRQHQRGESQWAGMFTGEWVPSAVQSSDPKVRIYTQYFDPNRDVVDDFEGVHTATSWQTSTANGTVTDDGTLPSPPQEDDLATLDAHSPHQTSGLLLRWDGTSDRLRYSVPGPMKNVTGFDAISFRITQRVGSSSNPAGPQDLRVALTDKSGKSRAVLVSKFAEIPEPHSRQYHQYTKSAMRTVRIPLDSYTIEVLGADRVDLEKVSEVAFHFAAAPAGEVEIDSVEFTK